MLPPACACSPSCAPEAPLQRLLMFLPAPCLDPPQNSVSSPCHTVRPWRCGPVDLLPETPLFPDTDSSPTSAPRGFLGSTAPPARFLGCFINAASAAHGRVQNKLRLPSRHHHPLPVHVPPRLQTHGTAHTQPLLCWARVGSPSLRSSEAAA